MLKNSGKRQQIQFGKSPQKILSEEYEEPTVDSGSGRKSATAGNRKKIVRVLEPM